MCMPSAHAQSPASASDKRMVGILEQQICRHEVLQLIQNLPRIIGTQRKFAQDCQTAHVLWYLHPYWRTYDSNEVQLFSNKQKGNGREWRENSALPVALGRPGPAEGKPPPAGHKRRSLIAWNDCTMARRVKIGSLHARCPHRRAVGRLRRPARPARRRGGGGGGQLATGKQDIKSHCQYN